MRGSINMRQDVNKIAARIIEKISKSFKKNLKL